MLFALRSRTGTLAVADSSLVVDAHAVIYWLDYEYDGYCDDKGPGAGTLRPQVVHWLLRQQRLREAQYEIYGLFDAARGTVDVGVRPISP